MLFCFVCKFSKLQIMKGNHRVSHKRRPFFKIKKYSWSTQWWRKVKLKKLSTKNIIAIGRLFWKHCIISSFTHCTCTQCVSRIFALVQHSVCIFPSNIKTTEIRKKTDANKASVNIFRISCILKVCSCVLNKMCFVIHLVQKLTIHLGNIIMRRVPCKSHN